MHEPFKEELDKLCSVWSLKWSALVKKGDVSVGIRPECGLANEKIWIIA